MLHCSTASTNALDEAAFDMYIKASGKDSKIEMALETLQQLRVGDVPLREPWFQDRTFPFIPQSIRTI